MKKLILNMSLVLGCLATVTSAFALSPPLDECQVDADCASQERCVQTEQTCVEWPEPGSEVCFTQKVCEADPSVSSCGSDADCAPDQFCNNAIALCPPCAFIDDDGDGENDVGCASCTFDQGTCEDRPTNASCSSDADCGAGERCERIAECASCPFIDEDGDGMSDVSCEACTPAVGRCQDHPQPTECSQDADCGAGQRCEVYEVCAECPIDGSEDDRDTAHCGCFTEGYCVADPQPNTCQSDADCGGNMVCVNDVICPPCMEVDGDGDSPNDVFCDTGCEERSYCAPRDPWVDGSCRSNADCGPEFECVITEPALDCPAVCEPADLDGDGEYDDCASSCPAPAGQCIPREGWYGNDDHPEPMPMPHDEDDTSVGELLGCQSTQQKSAPTTLSLLALGLFGLVASRRRRRQA